MIIRIWNKLRDSGISANHTGDVQLIRSFNVMSFLSACGALSIILISYIIDFSIIYIYINTVVFSVYASGLVLTHFGKFNLAKIVVTIGTPIWIAGAIVVGGGQFCQGLATVAAMAMTYIAFQGNSKRIISIITFQITCFLSAIIFLNTSGPILGYIDFPYDEITVFLGSIGWIVILLYRFDKERQSLVNSLQKNNEELKNTTEELERFTYIASHDLKSPLRTIISFIGLIERNLKNEDFDALKDNLGFVKSGAEQMNFLVKDILELSTIKNQTMAQRKLIDLNTIFNKAKHNLTDEINERDAKVYAERLPKFIGNELEFLLIFQNFVQNGIKYNESKQPIIKVTAERTEDALFLTFSDNGIGIDEQYHTQIFKYFKRLHNSDKYQGTGLGLGLCNKIIKNYNGEIKVDSKIGAGTNFTINFPIVKSFLTAKEKSKKTMA